MNLSKTFQSLAEDEKRSNEVRTKTMNACHGIQHLRHLRHAVVAMGRNHRESVTLKKVKDRTAKFDRATSEKEELFIAKVTGDVPLMQKSFRLLQKLQRNIEEQTEGCTCFHIDEREGKQTGRREVLTAKAVKTLSKLKVCTMRTCFDQVEPVLQELEKLMRQEAWAKKQLKEMRTSYLKEVSQLRDQARTRVDPLKGSTHIAMTFDPVMHCTTEEQAMLLGMVREKIKMIFDLPGNTDEDLRNCNLDQVTALKALVESSQLAELRQKEKRMAQEIQVLKFQVAQSEKDLRKSGEGMGREVMMSMEAEIERAKMKNVELQRKVQEVEKKETEQRIRAERQVELNREYSNEARTRDLEIEDLHRALASAKEAQEAAEQEALEARGAKAKAEAQAQQALQDLEATKQELQKLRMKRKQEKKEAERAARSSGPAPPAPEPEGGELGVAGQGQVVPTSLATDEETAEHIAFLESQITDLSERCQELESFLSLAQQDLELLKEQNRSLRLHSQELTEELHRSALDRENEMAEDCFFTMDTLDGMLSGRQTDEDDSSDSDEDENSEIQQLSREELMLRDSSELGKQVADTVDRLGQACAKCRQIELEPDSPKKLENIQGAYAEVNVLRAELSELRKKKVQKDVELLVIRLRKANRKERKARLSRANSFAPNAAEHGDGASGDAGGPDAAQTMIGIYRGIGREMGKQLKALQAKNESLNETLSKLQRDMDKMRQCLMSSKACNNVEVKACLRQLEEAQKMSVFDRLFADSQRRNMQRQNRREEQQRAMMEKHEKIVLLEPSLATGERGQVVFVASRGSMIHKPRSQHMTPGERHLTEARGVGGRASPPRAGSPDGRGSIRTERFVIGADRAPTRDNREVVPMFVTSRQTAGASPGGLPQVSGATPRDESMDLATGPPRGWTRLDSVETDVISEVSATPSGASTKACTASTSTWAAGAQPPAPPATPAGSHSVRGGQQRRPSSRGTNVVAQGHHEVEGLGNAMISGHGIQSHGTGRKRSLR